MVHLNVFLAVEKDSKARMMCRFVHCFFFSLNLFIKYFEDQGSHCSGWSTNVSLRRKHQTNFFPTEYSAIHVEKIQLLLY